MEEALCQARRAYLENSIKKDVSVLEARMDGMDKAVELKTVEMERRLEGLNELRSEVIKDRELLVKKEGYDLKMAMLDSWITAANEKLTTLMISYNNRISLASWLAIVATIISIINILVFVYFATKG